MPTSHIKTIRAGELDCPKENPQSTEHRVSIWTGLALFLWSYLLLFNSSFVRKSKTGTGYQVGYLFSTIGISFDLSILL